MVDIISNEKIVDSSSHTWSGPCTYLTEDKANILLTIIWKDGTRELFQGIKGTTGITREAYDAAMSGTLGNIAPYTAPPIKSVPKQDLTIQTRASAIDGTVIVNNTITNSKLQKMPPYTIRGNNTDKVADSSDLPIPVVVEMFPNFSKDKPGLAPASNGGTENFLRADGAFSSPPGSLIKARATFGWDGSSFRIENNRNIDRITRNGIGDYTVWFTVPFRTDDYQVIASITQGEDASASFGISSVGNSGREPLLKTRNQCRMKVGGVPFDPAPLSITVIFISD